jgi:hypothetical protein
VRRRQTLGLPAYCRLSPHSGRVRACTNASGIGLRGRGQWLGKELVKGELRQRPAGRASRAGQQGRQGRACTPVAGRIVALELVVSTRPSTRPLGRAGPFALARWSCRAPKNSAPMQERRRWPMSRRARVACDETCAVICACGRSSRLEWGSCVSRAPSSVFDQSFMCQMRALYSRGHGLARTTASLPLPFVSAMYSMSKLPLYSQPCCAEASAHSNCETHTAWATSCPPLTANSAPRVTVDAFCPTQFLCINLIGLDAMRTDPGNGWLAAVSMSVSAHDHQAIPGAIWPGAAKSTSGRRRQHAGTATGPLYAHCKRCAAGIRRARLSAGGVLIDGQFPSSRRQPLNHFSLHILIM